MCYQVAENSYDIFAVKVCQQGNDATVGHLPMEISRITKYILQRGAQVKATLIATHYRRSPLVQGVLEIPCKIEATMPGTVRNHMLLERYIQLVEELYVEPKEEQILGSFLHKATLAPFFFFIYSFFYVGFTIVYN